ncbi:MAG TPA: hypothetical protein VMH89_09960 [Candidatus Acidoferrum sp.]|nr:hypothetical protein [Candidatus Acidoferrum sp.]
MSTARTFYCNIGAFTPAERARHKQLTDKLLANAKQIVELENGYDFQLNASLISLPELAEWLAHESKCCPFFDFQVDYKNEGSRLSVKLTGAEGIKPFIRAEFHLPTETRL